MADQKRFQKQELNSEDYEKTEEGAKMLKTTSKVVTGIVVVVGVLKKYGPEMLKGINKIRKL
ncbi:MAG TPA: hypothetical protein DDY31_20085 [Lachnospiraceae bacterium]|nr:hypothetical protein [Lachnospiraceae bacterium]